MSRTPRFSSMLAQCAAPILLITHAALLAWSAYVHSPTLNEPAHLVAGISYWRAGGFDIYNVNPPLVRLVAALPVILSGAVADSPETDLRSGDRPEFRLGEEFIAANGLRSMWLMTIARWTCIPFSLLGGYFSWRWSKELYGTLAGCVTLVLWCFCPNILGHAQLITPDVASASLTVAACYTFWRWLKRPTWQHTFVSGLVLGLAESTKTTLVVLYPVWPLLWLAYRYSELRSRCALSAVHTDADGGAPQDASSRPEVRVARPRWLSEASMLLVRMAVCVYIINLCYAFEGTGARLGEYRFISTSLAGERAGDGDRLTPGNRFTCTWLASVPIPLPTNYVRGIDVQRKEFERHRWPSYLRGEFRSEGWWYYYLYALAIKVPLGTWGVVALTTIVRLGRIGSTRWRDDVTVLTPAVLLLLVVSSHTGFSKHMRYVLPIFPLAFVWAGSAMTACGAGRSLVRCATTAAVAWSIASGLGTYPHSLSYFNELAGGPASGPRHLLHSNVDWGQDLLKLKEWLRKRPDIEEINLLYYGYFDPRHAGINYSVPKQFLSTARARAEAGSPPPGWYAVSVNLVYGLPWLVYTGDGAKANVNQRAVARFRELQPVAMAGYSIYIYHVVDRRAEASDRTAMACPETEVLQ